MYHSNATLHSCNYNYTQLKKLLKCGHGTRFDCKSSQRFAIETSVLIVKKTHGMAPVLNVSQLKTGTIFNHVYMHVHECDIAFGQYCI